jgi:hypothetical protein
MNQAPKLLDPIHIQISDRKFSCGNILLQPGAKVIFNYKDQVKMITYIEFLQRLGFEV